ncbi:sulfotransferase family protein [Neptuniibacter sp. PT8_73]|uniref:sulfotransferase family protein n=1 Tax=Neptuniibacter sp. PT8_73 TaxID=3398206 RepID=UPI0039F490E3
MNFNFLMCSERSGSNLITQLLNSHPLVCAPATKHLINPVARNLFRYKDLSKTENWNALLTDIHTLLNADFSEWDTKFSLIDLEELTNIGEVNSLIRKIFESEAKKQNKSQLFIKENHLYEFMTFLLLNFPQSKFIYQTRDPRDMALSWRKNPSHPGGIIAAAKQWSKDQKKFLGDHYALSQIGRSHHLTYESLISKPEESIKAVLKFLGLEYSDNVFNFHNNDATVKNAAKQEAWSNLSKPIISNNCQKYSNELTSIEIGMIEKLCFFEMNALGYKTVNSKVELDKIADLSIDDLAIKESKIYKSTPSAGTVENIQAKKNFYLR